MKNFIVKLSLVFILFIGLSRGLLATSAAAPSKEKTLTAAVNSDIQSAKANLSGDVQVEFKESTGDTMISKSIIVENWGILSLGLLSFLEIIVRLTPSEKDNSILNMISKILNAFIPNIRKGGGVF